MVKLMVMLLLMLMTMMLVMTMMMMMMLMMPMLVLYAVCAMPASLLSAQGQPNGVGTVRRRKMMLL